MNDSDHLLDLSTEQRAIVDKIGFDGIVYLVTACAGAGKTRTLSHIVVRGLVQLQKNFETALAEGKQPLPRIGRLCLLTATRAAKEEAMARVVALQETLHNNGMDPGGRLRPENVRTIHSLALGILKDSVTREHPNAAVQIVSQSEIKAMLLQLLEGVSLDKCTSRAAQDLFTEIDVEDQAEILGEIRTERLKQFVPVVQEENDSLGPYAACVLQELEAWLEGGRKQDDADDEGEGEGDRGGGAHHPVEPPTGDSVTVRGDFNALVYGLASSKHGICGKGDILVVDEAQDLSICQMEIVLTAAEHGASVVVLGDDSQGIHVFSGAVSRTLHALKYEAEKRAVDVEQFKLLTNFRSTNQIVQVSESLLPFDDQQLRRGTRAQCDGPPVEISAWKSARLEADAVAKKIVQLVGGGEDPGNIVVQRHAHFRHDDPVVTLLDRYAKQANMDIPKLILGSSSNTASLTAKILCSLQIVCGVHLFGATLDSDEDGDGVFEMLQIFLRNIKGSGGCTALAKRALVNVFRKKNLGNLFDLLTLVDNADGTALLETELIDLLRTEAAEAALAEKKVSSKAVAGKRKRGANLEDEQQLTKSIKLKTGRFLKMMRSASQFVKAINDRFLDISVGQKRIEMIDSEYRAASYQQRKHAGLEKWTPTPKHATGLVAWLVTRDILEVKWTRDLAAEFDLLLEKLDVPVEAGGGAADAGDAAGALVAPIIRVQGELNNKEMAGRLVFSTIHKFKGRERGVAFVMNMHEPYAKVKQAKSAALFASHEPGCTNRHGKLRGCRCSHFLTKLAAMATAEKV